LRAHLAPLKLSSGADPDALVFGGHDRPFSATSVGERASQEAGRAAPRRALAANPSTS